MANEIGFVGLGVMGRGMVPNLTKAGWEVHLWNRTRSKMDPFAGENTVPHDRAADLATGCSTVMICVSDTEAVRQVIFDTGLAEALGSGGLIIDLSTISPSATREFANTLQASGVHLLDAPVSGGSEGAAAGTLSVMAGGSGKDFERARPLLQAIGGSVHHVGDSGAGQMVKIVNQILVVGYALAISEALIFAQAGGLNLEKTIAAVEGGAASSWMLSHRGTQAIRRDWRPGFAIDLQVKDIRLALDEARELGVPMLLTPLVENLYRALQREGFGAEGNQALVKALERLSGIRIGGD
jgi:3-hydroxyisobutyrate dehydrogenase